MQLLRDLKELWQLPEITVNLMCGAASDSDPFYERIVREFYKDTQRAHKKMPLIKAFKHGVALCELPQRTDEYFMAIEASARRNYKKAERNGYSFARINFNEYLADIGEIRRSAAVRQGAVPEAILSDEVKRCENPPAATNVHDYPYFGVLKDGRLHAYAGCLVAGEVGMIEHIYGHAESQSDGVVPMLIVGMANALLEEHERVRYYGYGSFYGAGATLRRFKKKFKFLPYRVRWVLDA